MKHASPKNSPFSTILIANRGEIACRIIRTAHALGYGAVAVFSDADAGAPHVMMADQAVRIGPAEASQSYLNGEKLIAAALEVEADAVHPGYGFLSEDPGFAQAVIEAGLVWIGPPPSTMEIMGHKAAARRAVSGGGVPLMPGYDGEAQSAEALLAAADDIGFPLMVKAAAGGGGRGMRLVEAAAELPAALTSSRSEAKKAFGSGELLLEKAIVHPRHIEFQVFGDRHGNTIHLGERDCSIQRRHQKVVEEAPSPAVTKELREQMGRAAVAAAQAVNYEGAGTVEFIVDGDGNFYFIEMNTRLQVEHPVTELVTGLDLVAWQLRVAAGEPLPLTQDDIKLNGHAIEVRLYAESPKNNFLPSTGTVWFYRSPPGDGIRVDEGLRSGQAISPHYDPMMAKIIAAGATRELATRRLVRALRETVVLGVDSNRRFLLETISHPLFAAGEATTGFVSQTWRPENRGPDPELEILAAVTLYRIAQETGGEAHLGGWGGVGARYCFDPALSDRPIIVNDRDGRLRVAHPQIEKTQDIQICECADHRLGYEMDGVRRTAWFALDPDGRLWLQSEQSDGVFENVLLAPVDPSVGALSGRVVAPMPGSVLRVDVAAGEPVSKGQPLLVLEAMKMEHVISASFDGVVEEVAVTVGQQMRPRDLLILIGPHP